MTKPMLCKGAVVRNIMSGAQTQDRRPLKIQPRMPDNAAFDWDARRFVWRSGDVGALNTCGPHIPPYQPGDIIWVRETICSGCIGDPCYRADNDWCGLANKKLPARGRWRPSIHMPKWACRLFLQVTAVRVERIRDISEADCLAEGMCPQDEYGLWPTPKESFQSLWDSLYPGSWARNDWVWVTEFQRTDRPEGWPHG